jgi:hypothetical protein
MGEFITKTDVFISKMRGFISEIGGIISHGRLKHQ